MSDRVVRYRVEFDQAQAQAQARQLAQTVVNEMNVAQKAATRSGSGATGASAVGGGGMSPLTAMATGALGGLAGYFSVQAISSFTQQMAALNTQVQRSGQGFEVLSGGAGEAERRLQAIQRASDGTIDDLSAMNLANRLVALGMAKSAAEMEHAVETGRKIATVMGGDVQSALENLSLAAANLSFMRLDQMGISATKVRDRMAELTAANADLGKEQAFLQAAMEVANTTFAKIDTSAAVSGVEQLTAAWKDFMSAVAGGQVGETANAALSKLAQVVRGFGDVMGGTVEGDRRERLPQTLDVLRYQEERQGPSEGRQELIRQGEAWLAVQEALNGALDAGLPGLDAYRVRLDALLGAWETNSGFTAEQSAELAALGDVLAGLTSETSAYAQEVEALGASFVQTSPTAQAVLGQILQLDVALASGKITLEQYTTAVGGFGLALDALEQQAANANVAVLGLTEARPQLEALGYVLDPTGAPTLDPRTGEPVKKPWAPDYDPATNSGMYQLEYEYQQKQDAEREQEAAAREWSRAAEQTQSEFEAAADAMVQEWESRLDQIPGLMGTSSVTDEDVAMSKAGVYQEKPDEWLRQLAAEVASGRDEYADADIRDAALRAGLSPDLDPKAIYAQVASMWEDSSLFAGGRNLDLINQDAVRAALARQDASASGMDALRGLFPVAGSVAGSQDTNIDPALVAAQMADADPAQMVASLAQGLGSEETAGALRDIGVGMAGHLYAGFAGGIAEQDWAAPILDSLMGRLVAQTAAEMTAALQP